eukprot:11540108-Alexandrium_andersonii.AAC.1
MRKCKRKRPRKRMRTARLPCGLASTATATLSHSGPLLMAHQCIVPRSKLTDASGVSCRGL